jgi:hypothetical protein
LSKSNLIRRWSAYITSPFATSESRILDEATHARATVKTFTHNVSPYLAVTWTGLVMRALALWGVCPDTGPACFSGRTIPACTCVTSRGAGHKRSARSSVQQPASNENRYQQYRPETTPAAVASLDWEGDWDELAAPAQSSQDQNKTWDSGFFAPVSQTASQKPLKINRDLLLVRNAQRYLAMLSTVPDTATVFCLTSLVFPGLQYRARLSRNAAFRASSNKEKSRRQKESESTLRRVLAMDPTDGRAYVGLGKLLVQQKRFEEARKLYDDGAAATGINRCQAVMLSPVLI